MLNALSSAGKRLVSKPVAFMPSLASIAVLLLLTYLFAGFALDLLLNAVFLELVPDAPLSILPYQFSAIYAIQIIGIAIFVAIAGLLFTALSYWYAVFAKEGKNASFGKACSETIASLGSLFAFIVFVAIVSLLFGIVFWLFALVSLAVQWLGTILMALTGLLAAYVYVKLAFTVQSLAIDRVKVSQALKNSWKFSEKRFWHIVLFLIVVAAINQAVVFVGAYASDLVLDDIVSIVILAMFWAVALSFTGLAMAHYFLGKESKGLRP